MHHIAAAEVADHQPRLADGRHPLRELLVEPGAKLEGFFRVEPGFRPVPAVLDDDENA